MSQVSQAYELSQKELTRAKANETRLSKELNQAKMDLNALNETCTQQKIDYEMELGEVSLSLNARLNEANEKLAASEARVNELESELAEKSARLGEAQTLEASLREEIDGKESTIAILKNSLMMLKSSGRG